MAWTTRQTEPDIDLLPVARKDPGLDASTERNRGLVVRLG
jgi:hypothetical protein